MPVALRDRGSLAPGPLDVFANSVTAEIGELEAAEALYVKALGGVLEEHADGMIVRHPRLLHPGFNGALNVSSTVKRFDPFVDAVEAQFAGGDTPYAIMTSPSTLPPDAADRLARRGYWSAGARIWMELEESVPARPEDGRITIDTTQDTGLWSRVVAEGVGLTDQVPFLRELARASREAPTHRLIIARFAGKPAGGCEVTRDDHIAFVRHLGVRPDYRRRGIAHALLFEAYQVATQFKAVRLATRVIAGSGADRLYERYGFGGSHVSESFVRTPPPFMLD
jgi:GNAT superfamily N-acetyltransferase